MRYQDILWFSYNFQKFAARRMPLHQAYSILGVSEDMDLKAIKKVYRRKAIENHPDRMPNATEEELAEANRKMIQLNLAWEAVQQRGQAPPPPPWGRRNPYEEAERRARREREARERQRREEERRRQENMHVSWEEASIAANVPKNARWSFVSPILSDRYGESMARVALGIDSKNIYVVGVFHSARQSYDVQTYYRMSVETIPRRTRSIEKAVTAKIREAITTVIGDANIRVHIKHLNESAGQSWDAGILHGGSGSEVSIKTAIEMMKQFVPTKKTRKRKSKKKPYEWPSKEFIPARTDDINLSTVFVIRWGESLPRWVAQGWSSAYDWVERNSVGKSPDQMRKFARTAQAKFKESWQALLNEGGDSITPIDHPEYGTSRHAVVTNFIPDKKVWDIFSKAVFWNGVRDAIKKKLKQGG